MIFGAGGQFGREMVKNAKDAIPVYHSGTIHAVDFRNEEELRNIIRQEKPDVIVNGVALTNVDACEKDNELAYTVNAEAVKTIAKECERIGCKLVHISTDYVFNGDTGRYNEMSIPNPINFYGLSKLVGDSFTQMLENSLLIRTSGVFGYSNNFPKFVYTSLKSGKQIDAAKGFYSPIHASNLAKATAIAIQKDLSGILNIAGERVSRYDLAVKIARSFNLPEQIRESGSIVSLTARRPFDSSLDISLAMKLIDFDFYSVESNVYELKRTVEL
ncbi:MAG: NAD(P)-dependent oxidoreductase [Thermoplasmatales archaeon]